ncbi:aldo/keto reductase (plasmid) [Methanosphaera sp. ISO3-F5]|uniref:aldo/keto reductase n=1 Tax=Methanosphaera sp. ISO3-F5 TaxID=1452353 RepID=UPI002B258AFD|nr:aldo/keto reductase [Methanosphaera sp. ISO3-F5]WQH65434.1 aldo/keto reductase [Methanosphaera sp. ISO3-F5]
MKTDKKLPKIALGAWAWGNDKTFGNELNTEDLKPIYDESIKIGLNLWDTAYAYGMGTSEKVLGEFLKTTPREDYIISTKFTPQCADNNSENPVTAMLENSMNLLNTDHIDIFWIHNTADAPKWTEKLALTAQEYAIGMLGVSNHNLEEIKEANEILQDNGLKLGAVQNHYSLLNRSSETSGILDYCKENDITFFSYMVLEQGALSGKYDTKHPFPEGSDRAAAYGDSLDKIGELNRVLGDVAVNHDVNIAQIPVAWAIAKGTLPIVGATKIHHVTDALKASQIELTGDEIELIEKTADDINLNTIRYWEKEMK